MDLFLDDIAFTDRAAETYLRKGQKLGFDITIHGDQFSTGGTRLATSIGAVSVDHLECVDELSIELLGKSKTSGVVLPGASLGLGIPFAPARKLLDAGCRLAIASDMNPGSAPMGDLMVAASVLGVYEKLSSAEVLSGLTFRASQALGLSDRGVLASGYLADFIRYTVDDYREILYHQGMLKPSHVWKNGNLIYSI